jgi:hypothetical protein
MVLFAIAIKAMRFPGRRSSNAFGMASRPPSAYPMAAETTASTSRPSAGYGAPPPPTASAWGRKFNQIQGM